MYVVQIIIGMCLFFGLVAFAVHRVVRGHYMLLLIFFFSQCGSAFYFLLVVWLTGVLNWCKTTLNV